MTRAMHTKRAADQTTPGAVWEPLPNATIIVLFCFFSWENRALLLCTIWRALRRVYRETRVMTMTMKLITAATCYSLTEYITVTCLVQRIDRTARGKIMHQQKHEKAHRRRTHTPWSNLILSNPIWCKLSSPPYPSRSFPFNKTPIKIKDTTHN